MQSSDEDSVAESSISFGEQAIPLPSGGGGVVENTAEEVSEEINMPFEPVPDMTFDPTPNVVEQAVRSRVRGEDFLAAMGEASDLMSLVNRSSVPDILGVNFKEQQANLSKYMHVLHLTKDDSGSLKSDQQAYKDRLENDLVQLKLSYDAKENEALTSGVFATPEMDRIMADMNELTEKIARLDLHSVKTSYDSKFEAFKHLSVYPIDTTGMTDEELANYEQAIQNTAGMDNSSYICELGNEKPTQTAIVINRFQTAIDYVNSEGSAFTYERTIDIINRFVTNTNHELGEPTALYKEVVFLNNCAQCSLNPKLLSEIYQKPLSDLAKRIFDLSLSLKKPLGTHELITVMFGPTGVSLLRPNLDSLLTYGLPDYERNSLDVMAFVRSMGPISQGDYDKISVALSNKVQGKPQKPERRHGGKKPK